MKKSHWLRLETRRRPPSSSQEISVNWGVGIETGLAPGQVIDLTATGIIGAVRFSWPMVVKASNGQYLESLAKYAVFFKKSPSSPVPPIDIADPATYDGVLIADNTVVDIPVGRVLHQGDYVTQYVAVQICALDRAGRLGKPSQQVEATTLFVKMPDILDMGQITTYENIEYTIVRHYDLLSVPEGFLYVLTVFPLREIPSLPPVYYTDWGPYIDHSAYGLFVTEGGVELAYLPPGTYRDVDLEIIHFSISLGYASCYHEDNTSLRRVRFPLSRPGDMHLAGILIEAEADALPRLFWEVFFLPVSWFLIKIPL